MELKYTSPTTNRFVAVLNKKIEIGKLMNALAHSSVGLGALLKDSEDKTRFQSYTDKDNNDHKSISDNAFIILKADNSNKLRTLREDLVNQGITFTDFTNTMTEGTFLEQHERTANTNEANLEYFCICFFCENDLARELTKKFSLFN